MKALLKEAMHELSQEKEEKFVTMSKVTSATLQQVLLRFKLVVSLYPAPQTNAVFPPFNWGGRRENDPQAFDEVFNHMKTNLQEHGVSLGEGGHYKLCDVHATRNFLNFADEKVGEIHGGTDVAIVPALTDSMSYSQEILVLFELKAENQKIEDSCGQAVLELLAARCLSNQPNVLVVLTDMATEAIAFHIAYDPVNLEHFFIKRWNNMSLGAMAVLVRSFIADWGVYEGGTFVPDANSQDVKHTQVLSFKRQKLSAGYTSTLAWEHFAELREDTEPNSLARAELTRQLFTSWGVERMPAMLHPSMYV
jgi:hypothetical protein